MSDLDRDRRGRSDKRPEPLGLADLSESIAAVDMHELGKRIKHARCAAGLSQAEVAGGLISTAYLSRIENGSRRPKLTLLTALAERIGITPHELLLGLTPTSWAEFQTKLDWAQLELRTGTPEAAIKATTELLDEVPAGSRLLRDVRHTRALALEATGDYDQAIFELEELLDEEATESTVTLQRLTALCRCYRQSGELSRAIEVGQRADRVVRELALQGTPEAVRLTLTVASAHGEAGDLGYAARICRKALAAAEKLGTQQERAFCYWNTSILESERGNHEEAVALGKKAINLLDCADSARNSARLRVELGLLLLQLDPPQISESMRELERSEKELELASASPADLASVRLGQARAAYLQGELGAADAIATACLKDGAQNVPMVAAELHVLRGQIAFARDDFDAARDAYSAAILSLSSVGADRRVAQLWYELGGLWQSVGCAEEALDAFRRAGASSGLRAASTSTPAGAGVDSAPGSP